MNLAAACDKGHLGDGGRRDASAKREAVERYVFLAFLMRDSEGLGPHMNHATRTRDVARVRRAEGWAGRGGGWG